MPSVTTTYDSPQVTGANFEDLDDIAYDISPQNTPVMSMGRRDKCKAELFSWTTRALRAPDPAGKVEAFDPDKQGAANPTRLRNVTQIQTDNVTISGTQQTVESAGDFGDMDVETARKLAELKRDAETAAIRMQPLVLGDEAGPVARQTRSLPHFIANRVGDAAPANETAAAGAITGTEFAQEDVISAMQLAYEDGGDPTKLVLSPNNKLTASGFTGRVQEVLNTAETRVTYDVTLLSTPFGRLEIVIDRFYPAAAPDTYSLLLDPEYYGFAWLRTWRSWPLAKTGDSDNKQCLGEWGLKVDNPNAHAVVAWEEPEPPAPGP